MISWSVIILCYEKSDVSLSGSWILCWQALYNDYLRVAPVLPQLECILDNLTPQTFDRLFEQVKQVNIDNAGTEAGDLLNNDRALMKRAFCKIYADFCYCLSCELPNFSENNENKQVPR